MVLETSGEELVRKFSEQSKTAFEKNQRILSFDEYLELAGKDPKRQTRGSAQYILDMMDSLGSEPLPGGLRHFNVFDQGFSDHRHRVVGQDSAENEIYRCLQNFVKDGINNKLILLHGPNGSAKSSLVQCLIKGLEHYSSTSDGALYRFNWIFPVDQVTKQGFGLSSSRNTTAAPVKSFAKLSEEDIAARVPCDLKDHPLYVLPLPLRTEVLTRWGLASHQLSEALTKGCLCHKCHQIFEALLTRYKGDVSKVLMHVQVERFYINKRYRSAAVTIEPQMHVDAQARQVSADRSFSFLPSSLHFVSLYETLGDLPDANRGLLEFADLLKRPVDAFKYLLSVCESGNINVGVSQIFLDTVFVGSANEIQLDGFKEFPDFTSFKARIELIRVPYLLSYSVEREIYDMMLPKIAGSKHVAPHTTYVAALWAVLTRLKKPNPSQYPAAISEVIGNLSPLDKAMLYDHGATPPHLTSEQKNLLKASIPKLKEEYNNIPYYEGRMGASAREIKSILFDSSQNPEFPCLSPLAVFRELEEFVKRVSEYEFLKQDIRDGYHDAYEFIQTAKNQHLNLVDQEVREAMGIFERNQYEDFLKKYVIHLSHLLKGERIRNPVTGKSDAPDEKLLEEFESIVEAPSSLRELESFRQNVMTTLGAYSLDHPGVQVKYRDVFPDFMTRMENFYFEQQKAQMTTMKNALELFGSEGKHQESNPRDASDATKLAGRTVDALCKNHGYCPQCAKTTIVYLVKNRYY